MTAQATEAGATFEYEEVHGIDTSTRPLRVAHGWDPEAPEWMTADTVIIATGAAAKRLDIPGTGDRPQRVLAARRVRLRCLRRRYHGQGHPVLRDWRWRRCV
eukprot:gnl/Ergobibamus_cyprinoides/6052.p3 GENE.gnl/Ergobibamus_cyprinoides/6052~~gnl/Ergobibamus_cyprinoides/6052.p3  ORF type:complete len:102 (+),score=18.94 gnl/Ergobibamus_cyprinoides/6052:230-535(+)